jgi:2-oxoglutarate dehydrogenase E1 component
MSGLVMLLPHGYEGQGPEHSSARIERFLQLCAEGSIQVANCTTPAQYFHLLRRQMLRNFRAPLVLFTPKSLLRHPRATSGADELARGRFQCVLDDAAAARTPGSVRRVLFCSGKIFYELLERRERDTAAAGEGAAAGRPAAAEIAIVRVEQLYPWPAGELAEVVQRYGRASEFFWVQEEPANMGAWTFVRERLQDLLREGLSPRYAGRRESASPATGSLRVHRVEQQAILDAALGS